MVSDKIRWRIIKQKDKFMNKKIFLAVISAVVVVGGLSFWAYGQPIQPSGGATGSADTSEPAGVTYFYGQECPHCQDVAKFLEENKIAEKVKFEKKEVWHDKNNQQAMLAAAKACRLDEKSLGVPFLFADGQCYIGGPDVEGYFKKAAGNN